MQGTSATDQFVNWYADGLFLSFGLSEPALACPDLFEFQLLSTADPAALQAILNDIIASLSTLLGVDANQLNVTITAQLKRAGGSVINVVTTSVSAITVNTFVTDGIEDFNSAVPEASVTGIDSKPLSSTY